MRTTWTAGACVATGGVVLFMLGGLLNLDVEQTLLTGLLLGAVLALVPDRTAAARLAAAGVGVLAALLGYVLRAVELPDTAAGRAVAMVVVVGLVTAVAALAHRWLPLWAALLGVGAFAGAYETTFAQAPAELAATSLTALSTLVLVSGVGFFCGALVAPHRPADPPSTLGAHHLTETQA